MSSRAESEVVETILVVDDDPAMRRLVEEILLDEGFGVLSARHGREALKIVEERRTDAVVLDLDMPEMDGRTFFRRLRDQEREGAQHVPVLILSALGANRARSDLGAEAAVEKPFDIDDFLHALHHILDDPNGGAS